MSDKQEPKPCHKDRACTFKDLQPCDDCEAGGDKELVLQKVFAAGWEIDAMARREEIKELVEAMEMAQPYINNRNPMCGAECLGTCDACKIKELVRTILAKHKAKNN